MPGELPGPGQWPRAASRPAGTGQLHGTIGDLPPGAPLFALICSCDTFSASRAGGLPQVRLEPFTCVVRVRGSAEQGHLFSHA